MYAAADHRVNVAEEGTNELQPLVPRSSRSAAGSAHATLYSVAIVLGTFAAGLIAGDAGIARGTLSLLGSSHSSGVSVAESSAAPAAADQPHLGDYHRAPSYAHQLDDDDEDEEDQVSLQTRAELGWFDWEKESNKWKGEANKWKNEANKFKKDASDRLNVINHVKNDANEMWNDVVNVKNEVHSIVDKAKSLVTTVREAPAKLFEQIEKHVIPTDATKLIQMIDIPQVGSASAAASLGRAASMGPAIFFPENEGALRSMIRGTLLGHDVKMKIPTVSEHHASLGSEATASLGGEGCIPLGIPGLTKDYAAATEYEMHWPKKLKNDVRAPDAFEIKLPTFSFDTCIEPVFEFPSDVGSALVDAFAESFSAIIEGAIEAGMQAINNINPEALKDMAEDAESKLQHIKNLVQDVKNWVNGRRRLLEDADAYERAAAALGRKPDDDVPADEYVKIAHADAINTLKEVKIRQDAYVDQLESEIFNSVSKLQHVFGNSQFGAVDSSGKLLPSLGHEIAAHLGFDMGSSKAKFETALKKLKNVKLGFTVTRTATFETGVKVSNGLFRHGDLMDVLGVPAKKRFMESLTEIGVPSVPLISAYAGVNMGFELPYYFTADAGGEFSFTVEVINEVFIGLENGQAGVTFEEPVINTGSELKGSVSAALQVGASAQLKEFTAGLCVLFVCTGPRVGVQQDFQLGFDLLGGASLAHGTGDSCINGPVQLATTFTDWDYSAADKERCHLRSDGSFLLGGYMQIPTPKMSVVMTTSLGVDGPGSEDPWHDFEVQDKVDAALGGSNPEFLFIGPLFSPVCEGNSGDRLETCGEGTAAAVSSSLGSATFKYDFTVSVPSHHFYGPAIFTIEADGVLVPEDQFTIHVPINSWECWKYPSGRGCASGQIGMTDDDTETQSFWKHIAAGTKLFTITTTKKVSQMAIKYKNPTHVPGWLIEENGVEILKETANRGSAGRPDPITYTYDFPNDQCMRLLSAAADVLNHNDQCMPTSMQISTDVEPLHNIDLVAVAMANEAKAKADAILQPGNIIALHNTKENRFVRLNGNNKMDASTPKDFDKFPDGWKWEKFVVVDGGNGQIALHNTEHNRFLKMSTSDMEGSSVKGVGSLPSNWNWERFTVVGAWAGEIGLFNTYHKRFMRMAGSDMNRADYVDVLNRDTDTSMAFKPLLIMTKAEAEAKAIAEAKAKAKADAEAKAKADADARRKAIASSWSKTKSKWKKGKWG